MPAPTEIPACAECGDTAARAEARGGRCACEALHDAADQILTLEADNQRYREMLAARRTASIRASLDLENYVMDFTSHLSKLATQIRHGANL